MGRRRDARVIYDAGRQLLKVRFLLWLSVACAGGAVWGSVAVLTTEGGWPSATQIATAAFIALCGAAFLAGMWVYTRHYVCEIREAGTSELVLRFPGFVGSTERRYRRSDVRFEARRSGRAQAFSFDEGWAQPGITVDAPWIPVRVPDRRWPLIMDAQGWFRN